ncbi:MAG: hypothetical protein QXL89_07780 [Nitrososphaeria archaeon]
MLVCLDGIDGAGKTTQVKFLQMHFLRKGCNVTVLKPFHFTRLALKGFGSKVRMLTDVFKQAQIYSTGQGPRLNTNLKSSSLVGFVVMFIQIIVIIIHFRFEIILSKIIYGKNTIIIYDRFYFDKLIPKSKTQYRLYYSILKGIIDEQCIILDVPTFIAYKRMRDINDKLISERYYDALRKWYRTCAKMLSFPIINTLQSSPIETRDFIISFLENRICKAREMPFE